MRKMFAMIVDHDLARIVYGATLGKDEEEAYGKSKMTLNREDG